MRTAREEVLLHGLIDWVSLSHVHTRTTHHNSGASLIRIQQLTLGLVRSLVREGLYELGELSGKGGRFVAWETSLDESMQRIYDMYVTRFEDMNDWPWACWLNITEKGLEMARAIEAAEYPDG